MMEPRYRDVKRAQNPEVPWPGVSKAKIICGEINGMKGPVRDIVIDPEYLDVTVPAGADFRHPIQRGHTALAYVVAGEGYFDPERDAYAHEVVGTSYFDFDRRCVCADRTIIHYGDGDGVVIAAPDQSGTLSPDLRPSHRGARGLVWSYCHEYPGRVAARF